jgi:hypothetical protein
MLATVNHIRPDSNMEKKPGYGACVIGKPPGMLLRLVLTIAYRQVDELLL